ncbi:MAG: signal peptidase II [Pseudomonadota bacterium]|nr:signal peptidase II [Pseudomonadota bacterium]MEE2821090.1 signal peptidase II [Pseudomonadota bacterium]
MKLEFALVIGTIFLVDQGTKLLASTYLNYAEPFSLLPFFSLTLLHNTGAAFSFLADAGGWQQWVFLVLALGVSAYSLWSLREPELCQWMQAGFVLLVPGAIGNATDRVAFGYVVDFLHFHWGYWSFPAFNVADISITLAAGCLLVGWYLDARHRPKLQS